MHKKIIAFGDLHLDWEAARVILNEAGNLGIDIAINLGDEDSFAGGPDWVYGNLYGALREFRDEKPGRELICCLGDKTGGVRNYLFGNYAGFDPEGNRKGSIIFKRGNVIAGHDGEHILNKYGRIIKNHNKPEPLVVFHGHSHSMGVLPKYKQLKPDESVYSIPNGERTFELEPSKVYWVNPGAREFGKDSYANFAVYDPDNQVITLRTKKFQRTGKP